jgi:hypothetical protein
MLCLVRNLALNRDNNRYETGQTSKQDRWCECSSQVADSVREFLGRVLSRTKRHRLNVGSSNVIVTPKPIATNVNAYEVWVLRCLFTLTAAKVLLVIYMVNS